MPKISRDQVVSAVVDVLRERLKRGEAVDLPGLGTFRVEHRPSDTRERPGGDLVMTPPRDEIVFTAHAPVSPPG